ncbi:AAA family ATPase [Streptomyces filamentosus]|uniref:AAA family ATPase n=1 Tax=Streptomyces filamentosus TaxID=67294 RepID=UPI0037D1B85D
MTTFTFTPATRETARARIGLVGPAGSGKTKTALRIGEGLAKGGRMGVADTERGSALKYAPVPGRPDLGGHEFLHLPMDTHDPRHLIQVVRAAEEASLAVLIVDSWSHFWNGRNGLLTIVEEAGSQRGAGGTFGGWRTGNPIEQDMLDALLNFRGHLIVTMRAKGDYVIEGKTVTKVGVKAIQREGAEYELDVVMDMVQGTATVTKSRYTPLDGLVIHHPGEDVGEQILDQLGQGVDPVQTILDELTAEGLTYEQALALHGRATNRGVLAAPALHPRTGEPTTVGDLIKEYGQAVKPGAPSPAPAASAPEHGKATEPNSVTAAARASVERATAPQMRMMHALFAKVGLADDRDGRLRATSLIVGRDVPSANALTSTEAATLLDTLTAYAERENPVDDFAAMLDGLAA